MKGFFLPDGTSTQLKDGDLIIFSLDRDGFETVELYRDLEKLSVVISNKTAVEELEFAHEIFDTEKLKWVGLIAAAAGMNFIYKEKGAKRTVFEFIRP